MKNQLRVYAPYAAVILLSFALRFFAIGESSYWVDEMVSIHFAENPQWGALFWDNTPFLYHLILKFWIWGFGDGEVAVRLLSTLFSVCTTGLLMALGRRHAGRMGALLLGTLHAVCSLSILYAQEARMYALFEMFTALNLYAFLELWRFNKRLRLFLISAVLMALSHYLAVTPLLLEASLLGLSRKKDFGMRKRIILGTCCTFALVSTLYLIRFSWPHLNWQIFKFQNEGESHWPIELLWNLSNRNPVAAGIWIVFLGFSAIWISKVKVRERRELLTPLLILIFAPIVAFTLAGHILERAVLMPRYLIYIVPPFIAWAGLTWTYLISEEKRLRAAGMILFGIFAVSLIFTANEVYVEKKAPWREAAQFVSEFKDSLVLTTRSAAVQTPYFKRAGIELHRWKPENFVELEEAAKSHESVWIIDNFWGASEYMDEILKKLPAAGLEATTRTFKKDQTEALVVVQIRAAGISKEK